VAADGAKRSYDVSGVELEYDWLGWVTGIGYGAFLAESSYAFSECE